MAIDQEGTLVLVGAYLYDGSVINQGAVYAFAVRTDG